MLDAKSLRKVIIPSSLIPNPSPAHTQSTRLALHVDDDVCSVFIASDCHVYNIQISLKETEESMITQGKDSLLIPIQGQVVKSFLVDRCPHRSEIQSIVLTEENDDCLALVMGTVDSFGHLIVSQLDMISSGSKQVFCLIDSVSYNIDKFMSTVSDFDRVSYSVPNQHCGLGESSWAGMCFSPSCWSMAAVAHGFSKCIDVYDQDIPLRSFRTLWYPASLTFLKGSLAADSSSTLVIAEGSQISIWDLRSNSNGGCVQRVSGSIGDLLYSVSSSPSGLIAAGGSDRTVTIYDPRRWSSLSRWVHCSKYEITNISFSSLEQNYMYVQGVDYEVFCGQWKENNKKTFSFRGDSNWLGFNKCGGNKDVLAGWCESGSMFVADVAQQCES